MKRIMLAAMESGSGKTIVTCALLQALKNRGICVQAFKCGPDYIDPMFHTQVLGVPSRNLDLFLQGQQGVLNTLGVCETKYAVLESAMGFYDGVGGTSQASGWALAHLTKTPVLLIVQPKGSSLTLAAQICGILAFRSPSHIVGILLNNCKPSLAAHLKPILERETGLPVAGYLPPMEDALLPSRHLGLLTAAEITGFSRRMEGIARQLEHSCNMELLLKLFSGQPLSTPSRQEAAQVCCRIAVARDEAFCFYYQDNLDQLQQQGGELVFFSPLHDHCLPSPVDGLYLGGGYPELYAKALSENGSMLQSVRAAVSQSLPTVAECGGFLYLQQSLEDTHGREWQQAGLLPGKGVKSDRLQRFGYCHLVPQWDSLLLRKGEVIPAHEFHYWDCTDNGSALELRKPHSDRSWQCGFVTPTLYAAFPHLHFGGSVPLAQRFIAAAARHRQENL